MLYFVVVSLRLNTLNFTSLIFLSSCHMNSTTVGQWEVQSVVIISTKANLVCIFCKCFDVILFIITFCMRLQYVCIQNVAFHDADYMMMHCLIDATMYDALLHCIMLQWIIMCYTILNYMMLHCTRCYTVKWGDPVIT